MELPFIELGKTAGILREKSKVECGTCLVFFIMLVIKTYYCLI